MCSNPKCRTTLISDAPNPRHAFAPHRRVAEAILDLIRSEPAGGKSIGLQGSWGSGKTTVVKLLTEELKKDPNYTVIEFDAWAHEGDPLRRTFLEALIEPIKKLEGVDNKEWKRRSEELAQRREIKTTSTVPHLTSLGKLLIFSLFLIPIGSAFLGAAFKENLTLGFALAIQWKFVVEFIIGFSLTIAPFVVIAFAARLMRAMTWIARLRGSQPLNADPTTTDKRTETGNEVENETGLWGLLFTKAFDKVVTDTTRTPNPTSVEFEMTFTDLMEAAFKNPKHPDRRIVLVVDNLDRVAAADALAIWSTLQTFLQHAEVFPALWIIVLYDQRALRLLWDKENAQQKEIALSFVDKSFQIRFQVPAPVVSHWHKYLTELLNEALPDHYKSMPGRREEEFHSVYRLFSTYLASGGRLMTPREMKLYINQVGSFHRQWQDTLPLSIMAYYALLQREEMSVKEIERGLVEATLPTREYESLLGTGSRENLAALLFNVEVKTALQLLLHDPINRALSGKEPDELKMLEASQDGFWEVLERIATDEWRQGEAATIANAARLLWRSKLIVERTSSEANTVFIELSRAASRITVWLPFDSAMAQGIGALLKLRREKNVERSEEKESAIRILQSVTDGVSVNETVNVQSWVAAMKELLADLHFLNLEDAFVDGVISPLKSRLRVTETPPVKVLSQVLQAFWELRYIDVGGTSERVDQDLVSLGTEGDLLRHITKIDTGGDETDFEALGWCVFCLLHTVPDVAMTTSGSTFSEQMKSFLRRLEKPGPGLLEKCTNLVTQYGEGNLLFNAMYFTPDAKDFVFAILDTIADGEKAADVFTPSFIDRRWSAMTEELRQKVGSLVTRLSDHPDFIDQFCSTEFSIPNARLYTIILISPTGSAHKAFQTWCADGLNSLIKELWLADLKYGGSLAILLRALPLADSSIGMGQDFEDALYEHAELVIRNDSTINPIVGTTLLEWHRLANKLASENRQTFGKRLYELAVKANGVIPETFFDMWGDELAARLDADPQEAAVGLLFKPLLIRRNDSGVRWISETLKTHPSVASILGVYDSYRDFAESVREMFYKDVIGARVMIRFKDDVDRITSLTVKRPEGYSAWEPDPGKSEFDVDWATAAAALKTLRFDLSRKDGSPLKLKKRPSDLTIPSLPDLGRTLGVLPADISSLGISHLLDSGEITPAAE